MYSCIAWWQVILSEAELVSSLSWDIELQMMFALGALMHFSPVGVYARWDAAAKARLTKATAIGLFRGHRRHFFLAHDAVHIALVLGACHDSEFSVDLSLRGSVGCYVWIFSSLINDLGCLIHDRIGVLHHSWHGGHWHHTWLHWHHAWLHGHTWLHRHSWLSVTHRLLRWVHPWLLVHF